MEHALLYTESQCSFQSNLESSVTPRYLAEFWACKLVPWILYVKVLDEWRSGHAMDNAAGSCGGQCCRVTRRTSSVLPGYAVDSAAG